MLQTTPALFLNNDLTGTTRQRSPALIFPVTLSDNKTAQGVLCLQSTTAEAITCEESLCVRISCSFRADNLWKHLLVFAGPTNAAFRTCYKPLSAFLNKVWFCDQSSRLPGVVILIGNIFYNKHDDGQGVPLSCPVHSCAPSCWLKKWHMP